MEVILLEDVEPLGHEGDIVRVADGHARNYLIPKSLAVKATKPARLELERRRGSIERREQQKAEAASRVAEGLREKPLHIVAKGGTGGRLHGSVTTQQIADALAEQAGLTLDRRRISLVEPIREVGDYLVAAQIYKGVEAQLAVKVTADVDQSEKDAEEESEETAPVEPAEAEEPEAEEPDVEEAEAGTEETAEEPQTE